MSIYFSNIYIPFSFIISMSCEDVRKNVNKQLGKNTLYKNALTSYDTKPGLTYKKETLMKRDKYKPKLGQPSKKFRQGSYWSSQTYPQHFDQQWSPNLPFCPLNPPCTPCPPFPPCPWINPCPPCPPIIPCPLCPPIIPCPLCPPIIPCPPCPPVVPCPPCPPIPVCPPVQDVIQNLNQVLTNKQDTLKKIFPSVTQTLQNTINNAVTAFGVTLGNVLQADVTSLITKILGLLGTSNSALADQINRIVTSANETLLKETLNDINTANANITKLVTSLASQPTANILVLVQDLTSPKGLLGQLLTITQNLTTDVTSDFATLLPLQLDALRKALEISNIATGNAVTAELNAYSKTILTNVTNAVSDLVVQLDNIVLNLLTDLQNTVSALFTEYGAEVNLIVAEALTCCGGGNVQTVAQMPGLFGRDLNASNICLGCVSTSISPHIEALRFNSGVIAL